MSALSGIDLILILVLAAACGLALRSVLISRKKGGCSCGCAGCTAGSCPASRRREQRGGPADAGKEASR